MRDPVETRRDVTVLAFVYGTGIVGAVVVAAADTTVGRVGGAALIVLAFGVLWMRAWTTPERSPQGCEACQGLDPDCDCHTR